MCLFFIERQILGLSRSEPAELQKLILTAASPFDITGTPYFTGDSAHLVTNSLAARQRGKTREAGCQPSGTLTSECECFDRRGPECRS